MTKDMEFRYYFDPLCGWCYASAQALAGLAKTYPDRLSIHPTGLFVGARPVSSIADHAWSNDQRIQKLTGQRFSDAYHQNVLLAPNGVFDSWYLTLALTAIAEMNPSLEPLLLHDLQVARYVEGRDTSRADEVVKIVAEFAAKHNLELDPEKFADRLEKDTALRDRTTGRIEKAQREMQSLGERGVPFLVVLVKGQHHIFSGEVLYHGPDKLMAAVNAIA